MQTRFCSGCKRRQHVTKIDDIIGVAVKIGAYRQPGSGGNALVPELELPYAFSQPSVLNDALDPPDHFKNAYSRDVLKGILISLAAVFVKASARLVACSAKACI